MDEPILLQTGSNVP